MPDEPKKPAKRSIFSRFGAIVRRIFIGADMLDDDWQKDTRRQYLSILRTSYAAARERLGAGGGKQRAAIIKRIDELLNISRGLPEWRDAFEAEQLNCFLLSGPLVDVEVANRLSEAAAKGVPGTAERTAQFQELLKLPVADFAKADEGKQAILFALVSDLQRLSQKNYQVRQMRLAAVRFVMVLAILGILLITVPFFIYVFHNWFGTTSGNVLESGLSKFVASIPNYGLFTAVSFGLLGALFSRFILLQSSEVTVPIDEAAAYYSKLYIMLRVFIGMVAAIIIYYFLGSGLLSGQLVPDIRMLTFVPSTGPLNPELKPTGFSTFLGAESARTMVPGKDFALLIVWSFLAGFSERLVPNLLNDTAGRIDGASKKAAEAK